MLATEQHRVPPQCRPNRQHSDSRQQIAEWIAALHQPGEQPTPMAWRMLHRERRSDAPVASHPDSIQAAHHCEEAVVGGKAAQYGDGGEVEDAGDERLAAAEAICEGAEQQRADRPHRQSDGDGPDDRLFLNVEMIGKGIQQEDDDEEIEGVQNPAENAGGHCESPSCSALLTPSCMQILFNVHSMSKKNEGGKKRAPERDRRPGGQSSSEDHFGAELNLPRRS
jgi:hypothetical protein